MKFKLKISDSIKCFVTIIIGLSLQSCSSSKISLLNQKCGDKKVIERLESKWNYPAIARENNIEGLLTIELIFDTSFLVKPVDSHFNQDGNLIQLDKENKMVNIFCQHLTKNLNETSACKFPVSKLNLTILYKMENSALDVKKYKYDVLIEAEAVKIIEIDSH